MNRLSKQYRLAYDRAGSEDRDAARGLWRNLPVVSPGDVSLTRTGTLIDKSDPRLQSVHNSAWSDADEAAHDERTTNQASDLFLTGFSFQADDQQSYVWKPQGLSGTADAESSGRVDGKKLLIVGWTYDIDERKHDPDNQGLSEEEDFVASEEAYDNYTLATARISIVDVSSMNEVTYRHILLVEPEFVESGIPGFYSRGTFRAVHSHVGGVVWYGRWLYVCSGSTVWIFDMEDIRDLSAQNSSYATTRKMGWDADDRKYHAWGYRYVLPAIHKFSWTDDSDPDPAESWPRGGPFAALGLDRSSEPHRLMNIQYCSEGSSKYDDNLDHSIVMFWDLDSYTGLPLMVGDWMVSSDAAYAGQWYIQGVHAAGEQVWMCSSSATNLLRMRTIDASPWETHEWAWGGEGLTYSASTDHLWNVTEFRKNRICFCVFRGDVGGP